MHSTLSRLLWSLLQVVTSGAMIEVYGLLAAGAALGPILFGDARTLVVALIAAVGLTVCFSVRFALSQGGREAFASRVIR